MKKLLVLLAVFVVLICNEVISQYVTLNVTLTWHNKTPQQVVSAPEGTGTASDPAFQQSFDPAEFLTCSIAHITEDSNGPDKRIAFMQDTTTGKFICIHAEHYPAIVPLNVSLLPESFVGPLNVEHSLRLPDNTEWSQHWLNNPKHPNLWVLGLIEK